MLPSESILNNEPSSKSETISKVKELFVSKSETDICPTLDIFSLIVNELFPIIGALSLTSFI